MLQWYQADLHIHTVLSACAELSMGPRDIVQTALERNLDIIAITDHNSGENVPAVMHIAESTPLTVIPGMEVATQEQVHLICLFPNLEHLRHFQKYVYDNLKMGRYEEELYGPQIVCDHYENILRNSQKMLIKGIDQSIRQVVEQVILNEGLVYPAHIDRRAFSIARVYPMLPRDLPFEAVEISRRCDPDLVPMRYAGIKNKTLVRASDAHDKIDIGKATTWFHLKEPVLHEIKRAIRLSGGRCTSLKAPVDQVLVN